MRSWDLSSKEKGKPQNGMIHCTKRRGGCWKEAKTMQGLRSPGLYVVQKGIFLEGGGEERQQEGRINRSGGLARSGER